MHVSLSNNPFPCSVGVYLCVVYMFVLCVRTSMHAFKQNTNRSGQVLRNVLPLCDSRTTDTLAHILRLKRHNHYHVFGEKLSLCLGTGQAVSCGTKF